MQKDVQSILLANVIVLGVAKFVFTGTRNDCAEALETNGIERTVSVGVVKKLLAVCRGHSAFAGTMPIVVWVNDIKRGTQVIRIWIFARHSST